MTKGNSNEALFEAIEAGDLEKVKALIDAGAKRLETLPQNRISRKQGGYWQETAPRLNRR